MNVSRARMKSTVCLLCLLVASLLTWHVPICPTAHAEDNTKIVNVSIIIADLVDGEVNRSITFLQQSGYHKWNIILMSGIVNDGYLNNATFVNTLKQYGELVPGYWDVQSLTQEQHLSMANNTIQTWTSKVGYKPTGFFMFQPDTYLANWLYSQGVLYVQGYCLDQYALDYMTMRGGWQMPYYASNTHILVPKLAGQGIIVFPHVTWDLIDSFIFDHRYDSNEVDAYTMFGNYTAEKTYVQQLMASMFASSTPFSYFATENEVYGWGHQYDGDKPINHTDFYRSLINEAQNLGAQLETYNETAHWFRTTFPSNPTYDVHFVSPNSDKKAEWYWCSGFRVTRYGDSEVVGYVNHTKQDNDPYLTAVAPPLTGSTTDPANCVDYSLNFTVDDFGHGELRAPPQNNSINYTGPLQYFPLYYNAPSVPENISIPYYVAFLMLGIVCTYVSRKLRSKGYNLI